MASYNNSDSHSHTPDLSYTLLFLEMVFIEFIHNVFYVGTLCVCGTQSCIKTVLGAHSLVCVICMITLYHVVHLKGLTFLISIDWYICPYNRDIYFYINYIVTHFYSLQVTLVVVLRLLEYRLQEAMALQY